jgi:hypothetical protein
MTTNDQLTPALRYLEVFCRGEEKNQIDIATPDVARVFGQNKVIYYKLMSFQMMHNLYNIPEESTAVDRSFTISVPIFFPNLNMPSYESVTIGSINTHPIGQLRWTPLTVTLSPGSYSADDIADEITQKLNALTWPIVAYPVSWATTGLGIQLKDTYTVEYLPNQNKFQITSTLYPFLIQYGMPQSALTWHNMGFEMSKDPAFRLSGSLYQINIGTAFGRDVEWNYSTVLYWSNGLNGISSERWPDNLTITGTTSKQKWISFIGGPLSILSDYQAILNRFQFVSIDTSLQDVPLSSNFQSELDPHIGVSTTGAEDKLDFLHATNTCEIIPFNVSWGQMLEYSAPGNNYARSCAPVSRMRVAVKPNKVEDFKFSQGSIWYAKFGFADQPF